MWQFGRKRKWWKLNDKLRHLGDSPITEREMTQLTYAEGEAKRKKTKRKEHVSVSITGSACQDECNA